MIEHGEKVISGTRSFRYRVVDVFTNQQLVGNALAVFPDASGIEDVLMQSIAKELNLSETSFIIPVADAVMRLQWIEY